MMTLLMAVLGQVDPAAEALKGLKHAWADFRDGATVTVREVTRRPDIDATGNLVYREMPSTIVTTVTEVSGEKTTLRIEGDGQEASFPMHLGLPGWARGRGVSKGLETIEVAGRPFACAVTELTLDTDKDAGQRTMIWKTDAIPYWAAKRRTETLLQGKVNTSEEEVVVGLEVRAKAGEKEVGCTVVESTVEAQGVKTVKKEWRSEEVPGRVVKREVRQYQGGKEVPGAYSQMEVVNFKARR